MQNEPRRFLGDAESLAQLVRANPVFASDQLPESREPLGQRDGRVLKDRVNLDAELLPAHTALPAFLDLEVIVRVLHMAKRALRLPVGPAHCSDRLNADLFVAKVLNGLD